MNAEGSRISPAIVADAVEASLRAEAARLDLEQATRGLDALEELALHPVLAEGLAAAGLGVHREEPYPAARGGRRANEGERCDFVLTAGGRALRATPRRASLFDPEDACDPAEALWCEVKVVAQFCEEGANGGYAHALLRVVPGDAVKLGRDPGIAQAALLLILFARDAETADHDLARWLEHCLDGGLPMGIPSLRTLRIADRLGNQVCRIAVYPVTGRGAESDAEAISRIADAASTSGR